MAMNNRHAKKSKSSFLADVEGGRGAEVGSLSPLCSLLEMALKATSQILLVETQHFVTL